MLRRAGLIAAAAGVAYILVGLPVFVFPAVEPLPAHADVAFVLGPPTAARVAAATRLQEAGIVRDVLVSTPGPDPTVYGRIAPVLLRCNSEADLICRSPEPTTTRGEARLLRQEAASHHWRSAIVVTMPAHIARARMLMERCYPGSLTMASSHEAPTYGWPYQYLYQTTATVKAWLTPGC